MHLPESDPATSAPTRLASEILEAFIGGSQYLAENVRKLAQMAAGEGAIAFEASRAIFSSLVEPLADSFEPGGVTLYNRIFSQVLQFCRQSQPWLDREVDRFGLKSEGDILLRAEGLRPTSPNQRDPDQEGAGALSHPGRRPQQGRSSAGSRVMKAIVLSRITLGADAAVTSILIERLKQGFPSAEIILIGGNKVEELFGGDRRISFQILEYGRRSLLIDRLSRWIELSRTVRSLTDGLRSDQYLVVDPDSRLTQLGLLPVCDAKSYFFFPSREYCFEIDASIGALASDWSSQVFGGESLFPTVSPPAKDLKTGSEIVGQLKGDVNRRVVCLNFGVGGNEAKRVGLQFEQSVIEFLTGLGTKSPAVPSAPAIVLDRGTGEHENALVDSILARAGETGPRGRALAIVEACEDNLNDILRSGLSGVDLLVWRGRIGLLAGIINSSDLYIGYDSMGQHIAAALGVRCVDVITGYGSQRFLQRWTPRGRGLVKVIALGAETEIETATARVERAVREILS